MPRKCSHGEGSFVLIFVYVCMLVPQQMLYIRHHWMKRLSDVQKSCHPATCHGWGSVRSGILEQRVVGMLAYSLCWLLQRGNAASRYTGRLVEVVVLPQKQWKLRRNPSLIQFDSLYVCKYLRTILEGILIALCWSQTQLYWESFWYNPLRS